MMPRETDAHWNARNRQLLVQALGERPDIAAFVNEIGKRNPLDVGAALRQLKGSAVGLTPAELSTAISKAQRVRRKGRQYDDLRSIKHAVDQGRIRAWRAQ